ncbi:MAG: hypothetical protein WBC73_10375 [Phormidesmis sp.]
MLGNLLNPTAEREVQPQQQDQSLKGKPRRQRSLIMQYAKLSGVGLLAFLVAVSLLGHIIPSPPIPSNIVFIGPKYDYYQAHKDDYTVLFFGSSRIYSQVIPEVFDATAQAAGGEVNSYNFGIPAMRAIDSMVLLEQVLADPPENLKWVFFESVLDKGYEPFPNARTPRAMYWHTWKNTGLAARYILSSDESWLNKAVLLSSHLLPFVYHQINVGRLFYQVLPSDLSAQDQAIAADFTATEGYFALTDEADPFRQEFLQNPQGYQQELTTLATMQARSVSDEPYLSANKQMLLKRIVKAVQVAGAEPIFVEPPSLHMEDDFRAAQQLSTIDILLSYKDPHQYPQLYRSDQRHDAEHLNDAGARTFTQLLAKDFSAAVTP